MLPRGKKLKPLVSECQYYKQFLNNMHSEPEQSDFFAMQLKGSRWFLRATEQNGDKLAFWTAGDKTQQLDGYAQDLEEAEMDQPIQAELCTIGVPRDPWDFLQRAVEVGHPRSMVIHLSQGETDMLMDNFSKDQFLLVKKRAAFLVKWTSRCKKLEAEETKLHQSLEPYLQEVLAGKRLLVFQEMLNDAGYPDRNLARDICKGFRLTGWLEKSNVFPAALKRPMHNVESAKKMAKGINHSIIKQVGAAGSLAPNQRRGRERLDVV